MQADSEKLRSDAFEALATGDTKTAFFLIRKVLSSENATLDDVYLAGEWSLDAGYYRESVEYLTQLISPATPEEGCWYINSAYMARAYARFLLGELGLAREDLQKITDDVELSWLTNHENVSRPALLATIDSKLQSKSIGSVSIDPNIKPDTPPNP